MRGISFCRERFPFLVISENREQKIWKSFPSNGPAKISDLFLRSGMGNKTICIYRECLIKKGVAYAPSYVHFACTLPRFFEYLSFK